MRQQTGDRNSTETSSTQRSIKGIGSHWEKGQSGYRTCCAHGDDDIVASIVGAMNIAPGGAAVGSSRSSVGRRMVSAAKTPGQQELTAVSSNPVLEIGTACDVTRDVDVFQDASPRSFMGDFTTETTYALDLAQVVVRRL